MRRGLLAPYTEGRTSKPFSSGWRNGIAKLTLYPWTASVTLQLSEPKHLLYTAYLLLSIEKNHDPDGRVLRIGNSLLHVAVNWLLGVEREI